MKVRELSRLLTGIEDRQTAALSMLGAMTAPDSAPIVLGITGPPGSGKSTLTDLLIKGYRERGKKVSVIAVDPSSPFTGGAILGDRIRMSSHASDPDVFIRSMATRGHLGGTSAAAPDFIKAFECSGYDVVIVETVGVGQSEVEITSLADTVILVSVPGLGDEMQAMKAGIMEIADIMLVNKKDRPGVEMTASAIQAALDLGTAAKSWPVPVLLASSQSGEGISELFDSLDSHRKWLVESGELAEKRRHRAKMQLSRFIHEALDRYIAGTGLTEDMDRHASSIEQGSASCFDAAASLFRDTPLEELLKGFIQ